MTTRFLSKICFVVFPAIATQSCGIREAVVKRFKDNISVEITGLIIKEVKPDRAELVIPIKLHNRNDEGFSLVDVEYSVAVAGNEMGRGNVKREKPVDIQENSVTPLSVPLTLLFPTPWQIVGVAASFLINKGDIFSVSGKAIVRKWGMDFDIPFNISNLGMSNNLEVINDQQGR